MQENNPSPLGPNLGKPPKVFISYSWSSPGHQEAVRSWAERLMSDGVDVIMDIYDLKEGNDLYSFMERMVLDPEITHVLVMCDKSYAEKSDERRAGVGTETQIISREVYEKVQQTKFIPIVCETSDQSEPFLPIFLRSRKWINFSTSEAANSNWEQLIRVLHDKPAHQKPQLGSAPTYIIAPSSEPSSAATGKFITFKQALMANSRGIKGYRDDFLEACLQSADALRIREDPGMILWGQRVVEDCGKLKSVRNHIVDWVLVESSTSANQEFCDELIKTLERLLEMKARPPELNRWNSGWFDAHSVFVCETFLYIVAALLKTGAYQVLHEVFTSHYIKPQTERYGDSKFSRFDRFFGGSDELRHVLGENLLSPTAALVKNLADRVDISFNQIIEAELLVLLMSFITEGAIWYPQTIYYASNAEFPFFIRATQHKHFLKLATITGIADVQALRESAKGGYVQLQNYDRYHLTFLSHSLWESMNLDKMDTIK